MSESRIGVSIVDGQVVLTLESASFDYDNRGSTGVPALVERHTTMELTKADAVNIAHLLLSTAAALPDEPGEEAL